MTYTIQAKVVGKQTRPATAGEDGQRGDQARDRAKRGLALGGGQHRAQQAREARVDVLAAQRHVRCVPSARVCVSPASRSTLK